MSRRGSSKPFADVAAGREHHARPVAGEHVVGATSRFDAHAAVQHDDAVGLSLEEHGDRVEVFAALGEHERVAVLGQLGHDVGGDSSCAVLVGGDRAEDLLDARIDGELARIETAVAGDQHPSGRSLDLLGMRQRVPDGAALHGDDRVVSVAALRGRGEAGYGARREVAQESLEREGWDVMALVDDDVAVA